MKRNKGVEVQLHAFVTAARDGDNWSASYPDRFTPREKLIYVRARFFMLSFNDPLVSAIKPKTKDEEFCLLGHNAM
jgi:hypothetical protein